MTTDTEQRGGLHPDLIHGALAALLWQGDESVGDRESVGYTGDPDDVNVIPAGVQAEVINALVVFMTHARGLIDSLERDHPTNTWANPAQVGHDWVLTSYGHGTGFWDRYSVPPLSTAGDILTKLAELYPCPEVSFQLYDEHNDRHVWFTS